MKKIIFLVFWLISLNVFSQNFNGTTGDIDATTFYVKYPSSYVLISGGDTINLTDSILTSVDSIYFQFTDGVGISGWFGINDSIKDLITKTYLTAQLQAKADTSLITRFESDSINKNSQINSLETRFENDTIRLDNIETRFETDSNTVRGLLNAKQDTSSYYAKTNINNNFSASQTISGNLEADTIKGDGSQLTGIAGGGGLTHDSIENHCYDKLQTDSVYGCSDLILGKTGDNLIIDGDSITGEPIWKGDLSVTGDISSDNEVSFESTISSMTNQKIGDVDTITSSANLQLENDTTFFDVADNYISSSGTYYGDTARFINYSGHSNFSIGKSGDVTTFNSDSVKITNYFCSCQQAFGGIGFSDSAKIITLTNQNEWYQVTGFIISDTKRFIDLVGDSLVATYAGDYEAALSTSYAGSTNGDILEIALAVDGVIEDERGKKINAEITNQAKFFAGAFHGYYYLTTSTAITVWVRNTVNAGNTVTFKNLRVNLTRVN